MVATSGAVPPPGAEGAPATGSQHRGPDEDVAHLLGSSGMAALVVPDRASRPYRVPDGGPWGCRRTTDRVYVLRAPKASHTGAGRRWPRPVAAATALALADLAVRQPRWATSLLALALPEVVFGVPTRRRLVALTFDDGPDGAVTPALLDVLRRHGTTATFFVIGEQVARHRKVVERIAADGHELGVHGMDATPTVSRSLPTFERELDHCLRLLTPWGRPRWFRPASGWIRPEQLTAVGRRGLRCVLGSVAIVRNPVAAPRVAAWLLALRARPGAVLVLHEGIAERAAVAECVDRLLPRLAARGYAAVSLSELAAAGAADLPNDVAGGKARWSATGPHRSRSRSRR